MEVLIIGHYGCNNLGDDAMLAGILTGLPKNIIPIVSSKSEIEGVQTVKEFSLQFLLTIIKVDWVLFGGGTFIHDDMANKKFQNKGLYKILFLLILKKLFRRKMALIGNGLGPINHNKTRKWSNYILKNLDFISVRDHDSFLEAKKCAPNVVIQETFDIAVLLKRPSKVDFELNYDQIIGLNVLPYYQIYQNNKSGDEQVIVEICNSLKQFKNLKIKINIFLYNVKVSENEREFAENFKVKLDNYFEVNIIPYQTPQNIVNQMSLCTCFIGMRYHSIVLAYLANIPQIPILYHKKCLSFTKEIGLNKEVSIELEELDKTLLTKKIKKMFAEPEKFKSRFPLKEARRKIFNYYFPNFN